MEAVWSAAVVLLTAEASSIAVPTDWAQYRSATAAILDRMAKSGNRVAELRKNEIELIENAIVRVAAQSVGTDDSQAQPTFSAFMAYNDDEPPDFLAIENQFSGDQLTAMVESLDANEFHWLMSELVETSPNVSQH